MEIYTINQDESEDVRYDSLNIVQLAAAFNLSDTMIGYFLKVHNLMISTKILRHSVPGSVLVLNNHVDFE